MSAVMVPINRERDHRLADAYANASEWTRGAAASQHDLLLRTAIKQWRHRRRGSTGWQVSALAAFRLHVRTNRACPTCKAAVDDARAVAGASGGAS